MTRPQQRRVLRLAGCWAGQCVGEARARASGGGQRGGAVLVIACTQSRGALRPVRRAEFTSALCHEEWHVADGRLSIQGAAGAGGAGAGGMHAAASSASLASMATVSSVASLASLGGSGALTACWVLGWRSAGGWRVLASKAAASLPWPRSLAAGLAAAELARAARRRGPRLRSLCLPGAPSLCSCSLGSPLYCPVALQRAATRGSWMRRRCASSRPSARCGAAAACGSRPPPAPLLL